MSASGSLEGRWTLMPHFDLGPSAAPRAVPSPSFGALALPCPVCQRTHGARLVRSLSVSADPPAPAAAPIDPRKGPRYYPPAVPVLSRKSSGPIGRTARWSLAVA